MIVRNRSIRKEYAMKRISKLCTILFAGLLATSPVVISTTAIASSSSGKVFIYNPRTLHWYAYQNGDLVNSGRASGGANYCPDIHRACRTPVGTFHVIRKGSAHCKSSIYPLGRGGARMDYCMFFTNYYAIHGSVHIKPYNASHGC